MNYDKQLTKLLWAELISITSSSPNLSVTAVCT